MSGVWASFFSSFSWSLALLLGAAMMASPFGSYDTSFTDTLPLGSPPLALYDCAARWVVGAGVGSRSISVASWAEAEALDSAA